jgi:hypothetical protein
MLGGTTPGPGRSHMPDPAWLPSGPARRDALARQETLDQIAETLGTVPGWLGGLPDGQLEHQWAFGVYIHALRQSDDTRGIR